MKTIFITFIALLTTNLLAYNMNNTNKYTENQRLCKFFSLKAQEYKKNMRSDKYAKKTLESYKIRRDLYCK